MNVLELAALVAAVLFGAAACALAQAVLRFGAAACAMTQVALRRLALDAAAHADGIEEARRGHELRAREIAIEERRLALDERDQERDHAADDGEF